MVNKLQGCLGLLIVLILCSCTKTFDVEEINKAQTFSFTAPYEEGEPYPLRINVRGRLNGKAMVYLMQTPTKKIKPWRNDSYTIHLKTGRFEQRLFAEPGMKNMSVVYEPLTATEGEVDITVKY